MKLNVISVNGMSSYAFNPNLEGKEKYQKYCDLTKELMFFCGRMGGECYSSDSLTNILKEDIKTTTGRMNFCLKKMHHSLFEHAKLTIEFVDVPKFIQMMLNNTYVYSTSERSARYTNFYELIETDMERNLYTKWQDIFKKCIKEKYPDEFTDKEIEKLAQENARYMISVFVPSSMVYTVSLRDINYTIRDMKNFLESGFEKESKINKKFMSVLKPKLEEFLKLLEPFYVEGLEPKYPRSLQIFKKSKDERNIADASYRLNYLISFAGFAQEQRHRSIRHSISLVDSWYIPEILRDTDYFCEWLKDIQTVDFPQAMLVEVTESGEIEDFVSKCYERCCGRAQREIEERTCKSLEYLRTSKNPDVVKYLEETTGTSYARCAFPNYHCVEPCKFGKCQRERMI